MLSSTPASVQGAAPSLDLALLASWPEDSSDHSFRWQGQTIRLSRDQPKTSSSVSVAIPLDTLIDVRLAALKQLADALRRRSLPHNPAELTSARRRRLIQALRALDGRLDGASYREIAAALFEPAAMPARGWKTHDLRDRTIRLVRYGQHLMNGGYRTLLLHPYRGRP